MALGNLQDEGDLRRFIESELRRPGAVPPPAPAVSLIKKGVPADSDFPQTPRDGILAFDKETGTLYARVDNEWVEV